jgi:E3 Ubiquitin ligase
VAILGILFMVVSVGAVIFGFLQHRAAKKLLEAPFHKTGEVASNPSLADAKGLVSFEGALQPMMQPLFAPASGRPCIYFEVEVERLWKKWETTENGSTERSGKTNVRRDKVGSVFAVDDGSGPMQVDAREGVKADDKDMTQTFEQTINMSSGDGMVGQYRFSVPSSMSSDEHTYGVRVVEKIIEAQGPMFVAGKHAGPAVTKSSGLTGNLRLSRRGREALIGGQRKKAKIGFIAAAATAVIGLPSAVFGEMPSGGGSSSCQAIFEQGALTPADGCREKVSTKAGDSYTWNVKNDANYALHIAAPSGVKYPIAPVLTVTDARGKVLTDSNSESFEGHLQAGTYKVVVQDADLMAGRAKSFKGGFSYIATLTAVAQTSVSNAEIAKVEAPTEALWSCYQAGKALCNEHSLPASGPEKALCAKLGGKFAAAACPVASQLGQCYRPTDLRFTSYKSKTLPTAALAQKECESQSGTFFPLE